MTEGDSDASLVARAESGDASAFEALVERYHAVAVSAAYTILADVETARDCAQDAFLEAAACLSRLREKEKFAQWIYGISRRKAIYVVRRQRIHNEAMKVKTAEGRAGAGSHSPSDDMGHAEKLESIRRALSEVPEIYREVLVLKYVDGRSLEEIAKVLELSRAAVDKRLMRGKEMLRGSLKRWREDVQTD